MAAGKRFHDGLMATSDSMKKVFFDISCVILYCQTVRYVRQSLTYLGLLDIDAAVLIKRTAYFKSKLAILYLFFFMDLWIIGSYFRYIKHTVLMPLVLDVLERSAVDLLWSQCL